MVTLRAGRCLGQAVLLKQWSEDREQVGELQAICLTGGVSHRALLWNSALWKEGISHIDQESVSAPGRLIKNSKSHEEPSGLWQPSYVWTSGLELCNWSPNKERKECGRAGGCWLGQGEGEDGPSAAITTTTPTAASAATGWISWVWSSSSWPATWANHGSKSW